jgi:L-ascorbate metabolism protein UlaG (beta-lactamase superfamily)
MIVPWQKEDALLADLEQAGAADAAALHTWWLGQSGFLVEWAGRRVLFDPYLSDSLTAKYAATDKPHVRMTERCVAPEKLTGIDWITGSHVHTDHLDGETLRGLAVGNPGARLVVPVPVVEEARRRLAEADLCVLGCLQEQLIGDLSITLEGVSAAHNELEFDEQGAVKCLGFILRMGPFTIYHSGDTLWYEGLVERLLAAGPFDLMLLPINGNLPERRVAGNLNGTEAAALARACGARWVVPCHYEMFAFNTVSPDEFVRACERLNQPHRVQRCGERFSLPPRVG